MEKISEILAIKDGEIKSIIEENPVAKDAMASLLSLIIPGGVPGDTTGEKVENLMKSMLENVNKDIKDMTEKIEQNPEIKEKMEPLLNLVGMMLEKK